MRRHGSTGPRHVRGSYAITAVTDRGELDTTTALTHHGGSSPTAKPAAGRIRVLLVEPRCIYAAAIAKYLDAQQFAVQVAHSEAGAIKLLWDTDPDVVVVCVGTHRRGVEVLDRLRAVCEAHLIVATDAEIPAATTAGHPMVFDAVITRIRTALRTSISSEVVTRRRSGHRDARHRTVGDLDVDLAAHRVLLHGQPLRLTRTEFQVLTLLFARPGEVVSRRHLQDELWGLSWAGSRYTLDVHIANLRRKLGDDPSAPRYVLTVRGVGYRLGI